MNGQRMDAGLAKSERERAWEQVFLRLLSLPREKVVHFVFIIDKDGFPSGGVTGEGNLEWQRKRTPEPP